MKFIHCSDIHLGTNRFGNDHLSSDFATAFSKMAEDAVNRDADAVIISGDFFNKSVVDPLTLLDAEKTLEILKQAGIEVVAVEGNHDISIYSQDVSWLHFLSHKDLLKLLQIRYPNNKACLTPWSEEKKKGAYLDINGVRFYGLGYLGASSSKKISLLKDAIEPAEFTVAMLHAGIDMFNDMDMGMARQDDVDTLSDKIDYVALGHVHGRYSIKDWMFNPGGLENWRPDECVKKKGYFVVEVNGSSAKIEAVDSIRRPGHLINVSIDGLENEVQVTKAIKSAVEGAVIDPNSAPIVSVKLSGKANFDLIGYDIGTIKEWIVTQTGAVECLVNDKSSFDFKSDRKKDHIERHQVERDVIGELLKGKDIAGMSIDEKIDLVLTYKRVALSQEHDKSERADNLRDLLLETVIKREVA